MRKLFLLFMIFILAGSYNLRAEDLMENDDDFIRDLNKLKNPFEDGYPKPIIREHKQAPKPVEHPKPQSRPTPKPPVKKVKVIPPELNLQGVIVGDDMHQAIINDQIVPLKGIIDGAQIYSVTKEGVKFVFKGKKFFLKVE